MRVIFKDIEPDDIILASRAVKWLSERSDQKDAILAYGNDERPRNGEVTKDFYVCRNKASITVRRVNRPHTSAERAK